MTQAGPSQNSGAAVCLKRDAINLPATGVVSAAPSRPALTVLLRPGTENPAIFMTHGLGGTISDLSLLATRLDVKNPVYGIQAKGIDGQEEPCDTIEAMAESSLEAIREVQPNGPYLLVGYSLGGLVMLEAAQRLSLAGQRVSLLALLDAYPHQRFLSVVERIKIAARLARSHVTEVAHLRVLDALSYVARRMVRQLARLRGVRMLPPVGVTITPQMQHLRDSAYLAWTRYCPRHYHGAIKFVKAERSSEFPEDPSAIWAALADEFQVETVSGAHAEIITREVEGLARVLSGYVRDALNRAMGTDSLPGPA